MANEVGSVTVAVDNAEDVMAMFAGLKPSRQRATFRTAASKAATLVKKSARRLAPVGHGLKPSGHKRKHLRDALIQNVKTLKSGTVSAIVGGDYRVVPHTHLAHQGAKPTTVKTKKRTLSNFKVAGKAGALAFGRAVKIPQRKGTPFLADALEANKSQVEGVFADAVRKTIGKMST